MYTGLCCESASKVIACEKPISYAYLKAFINQDIESARNLMGFYKEKISSQCDTITNDIITGKITDMDIGSASGIGLYARYLKRISAHSRNLISSIVNPFERIGYPE